MCGIIGYVGERRVTDVLLKGLKRLEYRGYDSSGVAFFENGKNIAVHKSAGKITEIERIVGAIDMKGLNGGIGHTRWATHGKPNTVNAHPHKVKNIVLVHNGIIENYREIRELVVERGYTPTSETDSELFAFLVLFEMEQGTTFVEAVRRSFLKITGSSSVVAMCERHPGLIVGIRNGSPLVAGNEPNVGTILASDAQPILDYTSVVHFLENGDMVLCQNGGMSFFDLYTGKPIERPATKLEWSADRLDKNGYPHYMLKEIHEQSRTIRDTLKQYVSVAEGLPFEFRDHPGLEVLSKIERLSLVACGTSWHASLLGKYWLERWTGIQTEAELASEFRYRATVLRQGQAVMGVSQSGETADTLAVLQNVKARDITTLSITNVKDSTISRESIPFYTYAGPEIGVASTKAFTAQLLMFMLIAGRLGREASKDDPVLMVEINKAHKELFEVPHHLSIALHQESPTASAVKDAAKQTQFSKGFFFIGRGYSYPIALEGALKLKEIAYVHAEGYAAGELKHGPIAMLEPEFTVIVLAPKDQWYEKTVSNLQEVKARGARTICIGHSDDSKIKEMCDHFIPLPIKTLREDGTPVLSDCLNPFLLGPILQLFSYEMAVLKGTDVDQPRNLAKSVTVE